MTLVGKFRNFLKSKKGSNEVIGFVVLLIFIMLVVAPKIKNLGKTTSSGVESLDTDLSTTLTK